jgi:MurNAc alpha-1-phosphate uridylyltransferase
MTKGQVAGSRHAGKWVDVGTPARLQALDESLCLAQANPAS